MVIISLILAIIAIIIGFFIGQYVHERTTQKKLSNTHQDAQSILVKAKRQAETAKKEMVLDAKEKSNRYRSEINKDLKNRRSKIQKQENRLLRREESLDDKDAAFNRRDNSLNRKEAKLNAKQQQITKKQQAAETLIKQRQAKLEKVAALPQSEARKMIISDTKHQLAGERAKMIKDSYDQAQRTSKEKAKNLVVQAIQQSAADLVSETTVSVVNLPNDDMKGRIIGREGRNIRTFETLTGIDVVIDDTPDAVVLSGFNPVRRTIAKIALEKLIKDGRIHPARIEEMVAKSRKELGQKIQETGENVIFDLGIHSMDPHLVKLIGRLQFMMYDGQNVLDRSIEVAKLTGVLAAELGENVTLAKRAGLLHEIGRAVDHEANSSHVQIGIDLAKKYNESPVIVDSIGAYSGNQKPHYIISELVNVASEIAASRPGAKSKSLESFIHRLTDLEKISNSFPEVKKSYAIQAGRGIRVIVKPDKVSDTQAIVLARDIKRKIEKDMEYPGHIKVTIIREVRSVEYAS
ncbi:ribonuclease Y [Acetilactobacillus jinshanensis]|uniref:Ribonuclease Y n=1 Tax=Acetilactobacillus jinshanensis TaxID=1720083 RepID=A0A4P6ZMS9_9LACO|nr:ribonuclease Y [Acetilactobacillus jinshanensis]QBP18742.1 ribonuclease Y [Acetilactobacillus jinshanensis]URL61614.1 ribonuclease Y [uncultured bacterium]